MKRHQICCVLTACLLSACASTTAQTNDAWMAYKTFEAELQSERVADLRGHISTATYTSIEQTQDPDERESLQAHASYPLWLMDENEHFQETNSNGACLTVNGTTHDMQPGSLSVSFKDENGALKADEIHYAYLGENEPFPAEARCPSEIGLDYPSWD